MRCRNYQSAIEKQRDDFGTLQDPALKKHLQNCQSCAAFYERLIEMENLLRSTAAGNITDKQVDNLCAAVTRRIAAAAPAQSPVSPLPSSASFRLCYGLTAAAAMLMVSLLGIFYIHNVGRSSPPDPAARFVTNTAMLQTRLSRAARLPEQSIQAEMQKLNRNARAAVTFLTDCIPASPAAGQTQDDRQ